MMLRLTAAAALLLSGAGPVNAQIPAPAASWGGAGNEMSYHLLRGHGGELLITGFTRSAAAGGSDAVVLRASIDGAVVGARTYGDERANIGFVLRAAGDGYVLAGWSTQDGTETPLLVRMDARGDVIWQRYIVTPHSTRITDLKLLDGGDAIVVGQQSSPTDSLDAVVMRIDSAGAVIWRTVLGGAGRDRGFYVDVDAAGNIVMQGLTSSTPMAGDDMLLARLDADGTLVWRRSIGGPGYQTGHGVAWAPDGDVLAAGYGQVDGAPDNDSFLYRLSPDGEVRTRVSWGSDGDDRLMRLILLPEGGSVAVGYTTSFGAQGWDAYVTRLDAEGAVVWHGTFGDAGDQAAYGVVVDGDALFVSGYQDLGDGQGRDILLFVTDLDGRGLSLRPKPAPDGLEYFIGHWVANGEDPVSGAQFRLLYNVEPTLGGRWLTGHGTAAELGLEIRDMWGTDEVLGEIVRVIFQSNGVYGTVRSDGWTGDTMRFQGEVRMGGGMLSVRETITRRSDREFTAVWEALRGEEWVAYSIEHLQRTDP